MRIEIDCESIGEAIKVLQEAERDEDLLKEIGDSNEGDLIYTPWGIIEV